jgi:hypothetical protein
MTRRFVGLLLILPLLGLVPLGCKNSKDEGPKLLGKEDTRLQRANPDGGGGAKPKAVSQ